MTATFKEVGFWDYTCPHHGSLEHYTEADWDVLLDDMAANGFNSLVLGLKWLTTGYRSRLSWLDQDTNCTAVASPDNKLLHYALQNARKRGMQTWALVVATIFQRPYFDLPGGSFYWTPGWSDDFVVFDPDVPGIGEHIDALFSEVVELFGPELDGLVVELEFCDGDAPHRIPIYNEWAAANNRPDFATIKNIRLEPRGYPFTHWRDFTTSRRILTLQSVERTVRSKGFTGKLSSIIEMDNQPMVVMGNVNLPMLQAALPHWSVVTYDSVYDRARNRVATIDFCVTQPQALGLEVNFLTRGVMTFGVTADLVPNLERQWRMSLEDAAAHNPERLWFMGSDCRLDGWVCSSLRLPEWGFTDARTARLRLLQMAGDLYLHSKGERS
jgi:hypothetical protein